MKKTGYTKGPIAFVLKQAETWPPRRGSLQTKQHNLRGNKCARGNCYDISCAERCFHSLRVEGLHGEHFASREIMRVTVFNNYIGCNYNRWRCQSACGDLSPEQFENQNPA